MLWLNVRQTAEYLGCSEMSVRRYYDDGRLNGWRTKGGARRVWLDANMESLRTELRHRESEADRITRTTEKAETTLREIIAAGGNKTTGRLPTERLLAKNLGAGRTTIRHILAKLIAEGLIRVDHGKAYYVAKPEA